MLGCFETKFAQVVFPNSCVVRGKRIALSKPTRTFAQLAVQACPGDVCMNVFATFNLAL